MENANDIVFMADNTGHFTFVNQAALSITEYEEKEVLGKHYLTLIRADMREEAMKFFGRQYVKGIQNTYFEYPILTKAGHELWLGQNTQLITKDDHIVGFQAVARDITDRKRIEEALRKSEDNYRQLFINAPSAIYQLDVRTGKFLKANDVVCEYLGCSQEEITSLSPYNFMTDESKNILSDRLTKINLGEKVADDPEYEIVDKNGKHRWLQLYSKNIFDSEGLLIGFDVVAQDITERKRAEEALKKSEAKFFKLFQSSPIITALSTKHDGSFIDVNQAFLDTLGYQREEVIGRTSASLGILHAEDRRHFITVISENNSFKNMETRIRSKNGMLIPGLFSAEYIKLGDEEVLLTTFVDITDRKRAEETLRDSESKYQFLAESMADVVFTLDINLVTTYVSPSIERMLGYTPAERIAQKVDQQLTPKSQKLVFETLAAELDREKEKGADPDRSRTMELEYYHKDGSIRHLVTYIRASVTVREI